MRKDKGKGKELPREVTESVKTIVWMARRYADGRKTYAPQMFNDAYDILKKWVDFDEEHDPDNRSDESRPIKNFPHATRGSYD